MCLFSTYKVRPNTLPDLACVGLLYKGHSKKRNLINSRLAQSDASSTMNLKVLSCSPVGKIFLFPRVPRSLTEPIQININHDIHPREWVPREKSY